MNEKTPVIPNQWVQAPVSDEIDLRELVLVLWRQKVLILLVSGIFAGAGIAYALLAPQVWVSQAEIKLPTLKEVESLELNINQLMNAQVPATAFTSFDKKALYVDFVDSFNSFNNKRQFLVERGYLEANAAQSEITDQKGKRMLLKVMAEGINAKTPDKLREDITLSFAAETADEAKLRLEQYITFIQQQESSAKSKELNTIWQNRIKTLQTQFESAKADTLKQLQDDILLTEYSLRITKAAGIEAPVQNLQDQGSLAIDLGARALAEKLKVLKEIKNPEFMNPGIGALRLQLNSLQAINIEAQPFQSFAYRASPNEPLNRDKPKRPLVVVLATLLGGMLGVGVVLVRHAFRRPEQV
ncbi:O-antigen chain length regulator [Aeromonas hydrophila]|uniref:LPS O-antigen chain length determinant protein WzzB n=1 Tax=Aeromonas hydrophila TaxID=644 RepID=UPI001CF0A3AE|nr:Wzz/FepE/Etk N-terminal domain-containing protein [Aeromonas hydrophila]MBX9564213.1 O-antigen chain length regulator [Aeromonas hydrophila]UCM60347.1 O-antigen chain length regulator [Aeromonas hydrophila]